MSLLGEARAVAAEFEYPPEEVNRGVKEFRRQMSMHIDVGIRYGD